MNHKIYNVFSVLFLGQQAIRDELSSCTRQTNHQNRVSFLYTLTVCRNSERINRNEMSAVGLNEMRRILPINGLLIVLNYCTDTATEPIF